MKSKRNNNVRRACDEIDELVDLALQTIWNGKPHPCEHIILLIKNKTRSIKRTTWRGDTSRPIKNNKMHDSSKDFVKKYDEERQYSTDY